MTTNPNEILISPLKNQDLIKAEVEKLIVKTKESLDQVTRFAIAEAWEILQLATASIIQIIEVMGEDLSGAEKKILAMDLINKFYDRIFTVIDIPVVPNILESIIHKYIKSFLMILVSSTIDALVTTFRNAGIFLQKKVN